MEPIELVAVRNVITASAPERADDLANLWNKYAPHLALLDDRPGFTLEAGPYGIVRFTARTMHQVWLLSFASWKALHGFQTHLMLAGARSAPIQVPVAALGSLPGQQSAEQAYVATIKSVRALNEASSASDVDWPPFIPQPTPSTTFATSEGQAAFELACIATAAAFLHEIRHVALAADGGVSLDPRDEEIECDRFATEYLLDGVEQYARSSGYSEAQVRVKRTLGIALSMYVVLVLTSPDTWPGSATHPAVGKRFMNVLSALPEPPDGSLYWSMIASWLIAHLQLEDRLPRVLSAPNLKELCWALLKAIDQPGAS